MTRFFILILLLFLVCPVKPSAQPLPNIPTSEEAAIGRLRSAINRLPSNPEWNRILILDPITGEERSVIRTEVVQATFQEVSDELVAALKGLPDLQAYALESSQLSGSPGFGDGPLVSASQADAAWEKLKTMLALLASMRELTVDLNIRSTPIDGVSFRLIRSDGSIARETSTASVLNRVWRGKYRYRLERTAYKITTGEIDLVATSGGVLNCHMVPVNSPEAPWPCSQIEANQ